MKKNAERGFIHGLHVGLNISKKVSIHIFYLLTIPFYFEMPLGSICYTSGWF